MRHDRPGALLATTIRRRPVRRIGDAWLVRGRKHGHRSSVLSLHNVHYRRIERAGSARGSSVPNARVRRLMSRVSRLAATAEAEAEA